jgi:hypothetical protein
MSLLNQLASQAASGFLANVFGTNNRSVQGDCLDISDVGSYAAKLAKYPQCAPYISAAGPITVAPQVAIPGSGQQVVPYTGYPTVPSASVVPIAYQSPMLPTPTGLPQIMSGAAKMVAPMITTAAKSLLPILNTATALASGFQLVGNLWYTAGGMAVGRKRKRRRINPLNYRAAMRAASRLCKVHDLTARISQALPAAGSARAPRRRRRRKRC